MPRKKSAQAKVDAELEAKAQELTGESPEGEITQMVKPDGTVVYDADASEAPAENPVIAKIKSQRKKETAPSAPTPAATHEAEKVVMLIPCEIFTYADYVFKFYKDEFNRVRPVLYYKKELFFSGWKCKNFDSARSLVIAIYYTHSGELKGKEAAIRPELLATHPLSDLIYPDDNTGTIKESFEEDGNRTDLFRVVVNPLGLALSGNTRLKVLQQLAQSTGLEERVHVTITDGKDDVAVIVGGNKQREKTPQDRLREAIAIENARDPKNKYFWTNVRNTFQEISGLSAGIHDSIKAVTKFVAQRKDNPIAAPIDQIATQNPTVAHEIAKLQMATESKDGTPLPENEQAAAIGKELGKMARIKSAQPMDVEKIYPGIQLDIAKLRQHYTGETVPAMAQFLGDCTPEMREKVIAAVIAMKKAGKNPDKLSILKARLEREEEAAAPTPDWNAENDKEAAAPAAPAVDPNAEHYKKLRQMGVLEDDCWILNKSTSEALNAAIGGVADVDPFGEKGQNLAADRIILATERPLQIEDWGGGIHASGNGLKVVTALPPAPEMVAPFTEMMLRIEDGRIEETAFVVEASVVFMPRFAAYFKSIPFAWVIVARENNKEATEGFGFEPSAFLHSHPRYKKLTEDNWNDAQRAFVILYYGQHYDRFERACGKYGNVCYNGKAAAQKSLHFEWEVEPGTKKPTAWNAGIKFEVDYIAGNYFLIVDGQRKSEKYKELDHAKKAAVIESLGF